MLVRRRVAPVAARMARSEHFRPEAGPERLPDKVVGRTGRIPYLTCFSFAQSPVALLKEFGALEKGVGRRDRGKVKAEQCVRPGLTGGRVQPTRSGR